MSEKRHRITLTIPKPTSAFEYTVFDRLIGELVRFSGRVTISEFAGDFFKGYWFAPNEGRNIPDNICLIISDAPLTHEEDLDKYLSLLKKNLEESLEEEVVWIIYHEVNRAI